MLDPYEPLYRGSCAAVAGAAGQIATYPLDVVRARMTVDPGLHRSVWCCLSDLLKKGGVRALYRGITPTLLTTAPFFATHQEGGRSTCARHGWWCLRPLGHRGGVWGGGEIRLNYFDSLAVT